MFADVVVDGQAHCGGLGLDVGQLEFSVLEIPDCLVEGFAVLDVLHRLLEQAL
ncbi:hypothetical protein D9M71_785950 [compost metagenome]